MLGSLAALAALAVAGEVSCHIQVFSLCLCIVSLAPMIIFLKMTTEFCRLYGAESAIRIIFNFGDHERQGLFSCLKQKKRR